MRHGISDEASYPAGGREKLKRTFTFPSIKGKFPSINERGGKRSRLFSKFAKDLEPISEVKQLRELPSVLPSNKKITNSDGASVFEEEHAVPIRIPLHLAQSLEGRSEIMENNIQIGLALSSYLTSHGVSPTKASDAASVYLQNEAVALPCPDSFSPFRRAVDEGTHTTELPHGKLAVALSDVNIGSSRETTKTTNQEQHNPPLHLLPQPPTIGAATNFRLSQGSLRARLRLRREQRTLRRVVVENKCDAVKAASLGKQRKLRLHRLRAVQRKKRAVGGGVAVSSDGGSAEGSTEGRLQQQSSLPHMEIPYRETMLNLATAAQL
jgi:hypothetical protein